MDISAINVLAWPTWLGIFSLFAILILIWRKPKEKPPVGKYSDSPIWAKPSFQYMGGLLVLIILGLTIV